MPPVVAIVVGLAISGVGAGLATAGIIAWSTAISIIATGALMVISAFTRPNIAIDAPKVASQAADANRVIVYGQAMVGGTITYIAATGNESTRMHLVVTLSGHEITSIDGVYFDNYLLQLQLGPNQTGTNGGNVEVWNEVNVYAGQVYCEFKLGAPGEPAFPALINETGGLGSDAQAWQADTAYSPGSLVTDPSGYLQVCTQGGTSDSSEPTWNDTIEGFTYELPPSTVIWQCLGQGIGSSAWTTAHRQDGCASVHIMIRYTQKLFSNGVPSLRFLVHGKPCVDPRTGEKAWSANPAVCIRDFLLDPKYGYRCVTADDGVTSPEINDANFIAAANLCDESVDLCSGQGTPFGPYSPVLGFGCTGAFNQYARILYWIGAAVYDSTSGNWTITVCSLQSANQVRNYITCVLPVGTGIGYGTPDGRLLWAPDPANPDSFYLYIGSGNGYGYYSWARFNPDGTLSGTLGEMNYGGGPLYECLSACIDSNGNLLHVGLAGLDAGGVTAITPDQFTPGGTWGNAALTHNASAKIVEGLFGQSFVLDGDGTGAAIDLVTVSGTDPVVTSYPLGATPLATEFDLEYCFQDGTLLFWWNGNLNKWNRTLTSIVASTPSTYYGSGPINSNSLLANGLDLYDPLTLDLVATGDGYNVGLPDFNVGVGFFHFYDPANQVIWLLANDQSVWGALVAPPGAVRYQLNGAFDTGKTLGDVLQNMLSTCAGKVSWIAGQWNLFPGAWRPPTLAFGDDDLRGSVQVQTKLGRRDVYTGMKGQYIEPLNNWQPTDYPPVVRSSYVALQNGTCQTPNDRGDWEVDQTYRVNDTVISFGYAYVCTANNESNLLIQPGLGPPVWGPSTSYSVGQFINDGESIQECTTAGTSGSAPPTWNETMGGTTDDGSTVVWTNVGLNWNGYWLFAGEIFWKDVQYPFTTSGTMAQRLARIDLEWGQRQITASWPMKLQAYQDIPSDVIQITRANFGWTDMTFEVTGLKLTLTDGGQGEPPALGVDLTLHQTDAGVYDFEPCDFSATPPPQSLVAGPQFVFDPGGDSWQLDPRDEEE